MDLQSQLSRRERQIMDIVYADGRASMSDFLKEQPDPPARGLLTPLNIVVVAALIAAVAVPLACIGATQETETPAKLPETVEKPFAQRPVATQPVQVKAGQVERRVLWMPGASYLDLDSGETLADEATWAEDALATRGVDLRLRVEGKIEVVAASMGLAETRFFGARRDSSLPLDSAVFSLPYARPSVAEVSPKKLQTLKRDTTYFFRTLEGSIGVVRLGKLAGTEPPGIHVEYRILQPAPWGDRSNGVRVRARVEKSRWPHGESPVIVLDLQNTGRQAVWYCMAAPTICQVLVDDTWYARLPNVDLTVPIRPLKPGEKAIGSVRVELTEQWAQPSGGDRAKWSPGHVPDMRAWGEHLTLAPGPHIVQVLCSPRGAFGPATKGQALSNTVRLTVERGPDERLKAKMSAEAIKLYQAVWAEPDRLKVSLWRWPEATEDRPDLILHGGGYKPKPSSHRHARLTPQRARRVADALARVGYFDRATAHVRPDQNMPLEPAPEKRPGYLLHLSVETDKLYQPKWAMFEDPGGEYRTRQLLQALAEALAGEPKQAVREVLAKLVPTAQQAPWGEPEPKNGLRVRARLERNRWPHGKPPEIVLDLHNTGQRRISYMGAAIFECQLLVDGKWYGWSRMAGWTGPFRRLEPGRLVMGAVRVSLTPDWARPSKGGRPKPAGGVVDAWADPLTLASGPHTVQILFAPGRASGPPPAGEALSNAVQFAVVKAPATGAATQPALVAPAEMLE